MMIMTATRMVTSGVEDYANLTAHGVMIRDGTLTEDMKIEIVLNADRFSRYFPDCFDNNTVPYTLA
ncbi:MAG TPA: hypothetical protein VJ888_05165 [Mobilitalea sp.]|nr:hypothetical protein [Mobilitalea sp.]